MDLHKQPHNGPLGCCLPILHVPWDETNRKIKWTLDLFDADGQAVVLQSGPGSSGTSIHLENEIEVGRPPGIKPGSAINVPFAVNIGPLTLNPDTMYLWVLKVKDREWRAVFTTRPLQQQASP